MQIWLYISGFFTFKEFSQEQADFSFSCGWDNWKDGSKIEQRTPQPIFNSENWGSYDRLKVTMSKIRLVCVCLNEWDFTVAICGQFLGNAVQGAYGLSGQVIKYPKIILDFQISFRNGREREKTTSQIVDSVGSNRPIFRFARLSFDQYSIHSSGKGVDLLVSERAF